MLLSPLWLSLVLALVLLALVQRRVAWRTRLALWVVWASCWLVMTPIGANAFVVLFSSLFTTAPCAEPLPDTVVVLGGGFDRAPESDSDYATFLPGTYERLIAGIALQQQSPDRRLVMVGGGDFNVSEAVVMATFARRFGVAEDRLAIESKSRSTWENAAYARALEPRLPERIALVTSALHLPRAQYAFEQHGFSICPVPAGTLYFELDDIRAIVPQRSALQKTEAALHEIAGLLVYRWKT